MVDERVINHYYYISIINH